MERKLIIVRHGKSSWDYQGLDDIDRPLSERGILNADTMARRLSDTGVVPDLLLSSPASRAINTALIMARIWACNPSAIQIYDSLYDAFVSEIEQVVAGVPRKIRNLAIFGHNPSFTLFTNKFLKQPIDNLPTAGMGIITLDSEGWDKIGKSNVSGAYVDYPKRIHP